MKIALFIKDELDDEVLSTFLISKISEHGFDFDQDNPDVVIFVGGDGTLLRAAHQYIDDIDNISFLGIHQGRLGFYTSYTLEEIDEALSDLENDDYHLITTRLLEASLGENKVYGVNEIRIENPFHTFESNVYINDEFLETYRGNGLSICSTNGSSAYNKSLGGALLMPELEALQLTEIAPINNRVYRSLGSPLIVSGSSFIRLEGKFTGAVVGFDHLNKKYGGDDIVISLSNKELNVIYKSNHSYIKKLGEAFIKE